MSYGEFLKYAQQAGLAIAKPATITGTPGIGNTLTATLPTGVVGTLQWTRTTKAVPPVKSNIASAVANAVNSLAYLQQQADAGCVIGCDASNQVSPSAGIDVPAAPSAPVSFVIFAGQSQLNSNGNTSAQTVPTAIAGPMPNVKTWDPVTNTFLTYQAQVTSAQHLKVGAYVDTSNNYFGPEAEFARRWVIDHPGETLYMVKLGYSTSSLQQGARQPNRGCWDPNLRGDLYDQMKAWVEAAKANLVASGKTVSVRDFIMAQGETDTDTQALAQSYASASITFQQRLRTDGIIDPTTPFIASRIQLNAAWPFPNELRASQQFVADTTPYCRWVDADSCTLGGGNPAGSDTVHYGPAGVVTLGGLLYDESLNGTEIARDYSARMTVAATGPRLTAIATLIDTLIANNLWSGVSSMNLLAAETAQAALVNVRRTGVTPVNSGMTFTANQGLTGTSTTSFLNTKVNPVVDTKIGRGNVAYGFYIRGNIATAGVDMGFNVADASGAACIIAVGKNPDNCGFRINNSNTGASNTFVGPTDVSGWWSASRTGINSATFTQNGVQKGITDTVLPDVAENGREIFLGNRNSSNDTSGTNGTLRQYGVFVAGTCRTLAQEAIFANAITTYLTAIGAN